jgi:hypothetical protein
MTRPATKPPRSPRRAGAVLVLLTPEERERVKAAATQAGLAVGPYLRSLALADVERRMDIDRFRCPECGHLTGTSYRGHKHGCSRALVPPSP